MIQTWALFVDAYRELNARKMFWVTLILSALFIGLFGLLGYDANGFTIFGKSLPFPMPHVWYKWIFSTFLIGVWAKWASLVLALISTASIFPDLLTAGSVDLYLSKPIGRLRLFLTKYATGLIFALLQGTVFAIGGFVVFGLRAGEWRPELLLLIPLIGLLFSYLFCVCTLLGVLTRSTISAILLTVLFWFVCFGVNFGETALDQLAAMSVARADAQDDVARDVDVELRDLEANPSVTNVFGIRARRAKERGERARTIAAEERRSVETIRYWHRLVYGVASAIPKTSETVNLIDRKLFSDADLLTIAEAGQPRERRERRRAREAAVVAATNPTEADLEEDARDRARHEETVRQEKEAAIRASRSRSVPWILGTSLAFEAVILAWAAWVFCRRDY